jgi:tagatose 1,6-diphosphate aldolase
MSKVVMTRGKFDGINACADARGVIAAAAMDQRGSLQKAIGTSRGEGGKATAEDLSEFKIAVTKILTKYASAILLDPEYGLEALKVRAPGSGVLLAYEKTGYDATVKGRLPDLLDEWSVPRLVEAGANAIKILLYYDPYEDEAINRVKHAFIERIGGECAATDVPFFLEPVYYDDTPGLSDLDQARRKPEAVTRYMEEFSKPGYHVDVLKVEVPINMRFVEGTRAFKGTAAYSRADAMRLFREAASAARKPFIYLSAGVSDEVFHETLELAAEAGTRFAGVLCGRATWQEGVPVYAREGIGALEAWLEDKGVRNVTSMNEILAKGAHPWWEAYGGKDNVTVVDRVIS